MLFLVYRLMLSLLILPKMITLSSFYCSWSQDSVKIEFIQPVLANTITERERYLADKMVKLQQKYIKSKFLIS
jgi:hypothetical protein